MGAEGPPRVVLQIENRSNQDFFSRNHRHEAPEPGAFPHLRLHWGAAGRLGRARRASAQPDPAAKPAQSKPAITLPAALSFKGSAARPASHLGRLGLALPRVPMPAAGLAGSKAARPASNWKPSCSPGPHSAPTQPTRNPGGQSHLPRAQVLKVSRGAVSGRQTSLKEVKKGKWGTSLLPQVKSSVAKNQGFTSPVPFPRAVLGPRFTEERGHGPHNLGPKLV